ncbi:hypothetical protein JOC37_001309 [Desulfohalotomaculum tongense]|uniref:hypothetical protein n=1 Tax=Desulforadius tongensis TaxID=1216062 RepID=UPI00195AC6F2|nr:hypothetical protein [Desulforadius tongensis]MBM7854929.1 hypothetical protein [Desulforadius tongensis]
MQNARLPNGQIINAYEYDRLIHGDKIYCCYCKAEVIYVGIGNRNNVPFFRTTGRNKSVHEDYCPEKRQIKQIKTLKALNKYTVDINKANLNDFHVIKVDFSNNDIARIPHGEISEISKNNSKKRLNYTLSYSNRKNCLVRRITSLATIAKILQQNTPEQLRKIALDIGGKMVPINQLVIEQNKAYEISKTGNFYLPWFIVYGKVRSVVKLNKIMFINFDEQDGLKPFAAYIFSGYYKYFTYTKEQLEGKHILVQGNIKFNEKYNKAEIQVMCNNQLYIMK